MKIVFLSQGVYIGETIEFILGWLFL